MSEVSQQEVVDWLLYKREGVYTACDRATRATGRLCKMVTVNDMAHLSLSKVRARA